MRPVRRGLGALARLVRLVTLAIAALIVIAILFRVLEANAGNQVVEWVTDAARFLVGPFDTLFSLKDEKLEIAVNWGIAAALWVAAGAVLAKLLGR